MAQRPNNIRALVKCIFSSKSLTGIPCAARGVMTNADLYNNYKASDDILQTQSGEVLYAGLTSRELLKTLINLQLVAYEPAVDLTVKVLTSRLMDSVLFQTPVLAVLKNTAYSHFCAGEDVEEASKTLRRMWERGLRGIITYGLEDATDNDSCDKNLESFMKVVQQTSHLPQGSVSHNSLLSQKSFTYLRISILCWSSLFSRFSSRSMAKKQILQHKYMFQL